MKVWLTDGNGGFTLNERPDPVPAMGEVLVRIHAASVGPRDLRLAGQRAGLRVGSDFAGVVEQVAGRMAFNAGDRVVGVVPAGGLAERIAVSAGSLCRLDDSVQSAIAAASAATGLTALYALDRAGSLLGKRVLVTAAGGAVGLLACQLARLGGAQVFGQVRSEPAAVLLRDLGVRVTVSDTLTAASIPDPVDVAIEMVGGESFAAALRALAPGGRLIVVGAAGAEMSNIDTAGLYQNHVEITGFALFPELAAKPASLGLERLFGYFAEGKLLPPAYEVWPAAAPKDSQGGARSVQSFI